MIRSKQELVDFALRQNGAPVVNIEVDEEQLEDCIDLTIQFFQREHYEGIERDYVALTVSAQDVSNGYFTMPDSIFSVIRVVNPSNVFNGVDTLFDVQYQVMANEMHRITSGGGINYFYANMAYLSDLDFILRKEKTLRFNSRMNRVYVDTNWSVSFVEGAKVLFEVYRAVDPEEFAKVYDDLWVRQYMTQQVKKIWGMNTKKYGNMTLPGGLVINGQNMYDEANAEIKALEQEARDAGAPLRMMIG